NNDRLAVLGTLDGGPMPGDVFLAANGLDFNFPNPLVYRIDQSTGKIAQEIRSPEFVNGTVTAIKLGPDNTLYVGLSLAFDDTEGEIVHLDLQGNTLGTIPLPENLPGVFGSAYPWGFDIAPDGSLWLAQDSTGQVVHLDAAGQVLASYAVA